MEAKLSELELKVLYDISRMAGQALQLDQTLESVLRILSRSLAMERATVTLRDPETGYLKIHASHGMLEEEKKRGIYGPDEGITGLIFRTAQPFVVPDISREPLFLNKTRSRNIEKGSIAFIGVPIQLQGRPIGVISVDRLFESEVSFEEDMCFLTIVATLIAQFVSLNLQVRERERTAARENLALKAEVSEKYNHFFMVGVSPAMMELQQLIDKVAPSRASVLLLGQSGTGKTLIARIIHEMSTRARCPFVKINCAALPEALLESELFGHEKGAFTGATQAKPGRFEEADGGTAFLDEIGELSLKLQAKLLRFLQEREFERLGGTRTRRVDARMIAATNRDLAEAVNEGAFRGDLYYRLNVFPIQVPPLHDRREDIPLLADYFLEKAAREYGKPLHFTPRSIEVLQDYPWPGNVRELENLIERLAIMMEGPLIDIKQLPSFLIFGPKDAALLDPEPLSRLEELERKEILAALERHRWIQSRAAQHLGLTSRQMGYRVKKFGLDRMLKDHRRRRSNPQDSGYAPVSTP